MRSRATAVALHPVTVACAVAAVTVVRQGFEFGINNNVFHIPIVLGWPALPQFSDDLTIQSLSSFVTPVYPALALVLDESTIQPAFFVLHVVTRVLTCLALYGLVGLCGVTDRWSRAAALAVVCLVTPAYGFTPVAKAGMFLSYFTHTELAQAIALFALAAIARGRIGRAGWLAGLAFLVNAFVGVWLLVPLGLAAAGRLRSAEGGAAAGPLLTAAAGLALSAAPVVIWTTRLPADAVTFDYRAFLVYYFPDHFMLGGQSADEFARAVGLLMTATAALTVLPRSSSRAFARLMIGILTVFAAGVLVGAFATSRFVLNLHLLRVDGLITWLCLVAVAAGIAHAFSTRRILPSLAACAVVAALMTAMEAPGILLLTGAGLALAARRVWLREPRARPKMLTPLVAGALFVLTLGSAHWVWWVDPSAPWTIPADRQPTDRHLVGWTPERPEWAEVKAWAASTTPTDAVFLTPLQLEDFRIGTRRRSWVDWKEGAAAMWAPHTYSRWRQRLDQVKALDTVRALLAYADRNGIDFVVLDKRIWPAEAVTPVEDWFVFENRWFAVAKVR